MRRGEVLKVLEKKYTDYRDQAIAGIKDLASDSRQSGDDSGLENVWEEFKYQVQTGEESFAFYSYVETFSAICKKVLLGLPNHELEFLWLACDGYFDYDDDDDGPPRRDELMDGVERELYQRVFYIAESEDLKFDPDEHRLADGNTKQ